MDETQATSKLTKAERKAARKAELQAKANSQAETGGTTGGKILDNGPNDPATSQIETPGGSQTAKVQDNAPSQADEKANAATTQQGREDGLKIKEADASSFKVFRQVILERAENFAKLGLNSKGDLHEGPQCWLDGFGEIVGKVKKSEVRAIFIAACIGPKELVTGYRKGDESKGEDAKLEYVLKETHTGMEWLKACTSYDEMKKRARDVKGKDGDRNKVTKIVTELSNKSFDAVQETLKGASGTQASVVVQGALNKMQAAVGSDRMLLSALLGVCIRLDQSSKDPAIKAFSEKVGNETQSLIARIEKAAIEAGVVKAPVSQMVIPQAPAPAEAVTDVRTGTEG